MSLESQSELQSFHSFLSEVVVKGEPHPTPEEVLDQWREENPPSEDELAILEALDAMEAGDEGMPADQFIRELREELGSPAQS